MTLIKPITVIHTLIVALFAIMTSSAHGQNVYYNINLTLTDAPNTATYKAGDTYLAVLELDQSSLTKNGEEVLVVGSGLISIDFLFIDNARYDEADDPSNGFPRAFFNKGLLTGFDYWNSKGLDGGGRNSFFRFFRDGSYQYSPEGASEFHGTYAISPKASPAPEPSTSLFLLLSSSLLFIRKRHPR